MSNIVAVIIFIFVILFLQIGILPHLAILGAYPNLILVSISALSILRGWKKTLPWIIIGGLFLDIYSLRNFLGISVIILIIAAYLAYHLSQNTFKKTTLSSLALIFLITIFIYNLLMTVLYRLPSIGFDFKFTAFIMAIIYNWIIALPVFYLIKRYAQFRKI